MPLNTLEYAQILQTKLDQKMVEASTSGWMEANAGQVIYNGGREVKVPVMDLTGLKDYDRDDGYPKGSVTLSYQTLTMGMDRGTSFQLDSMDVNESNFIASATTVSGEFQRTQVVPEVDAYRYSKIAAMAEKTGRTCDVDEKNVYSELVDDIATVRDLVGETEPLVCCISARVKAKLEKMADFHRLVDVADFTQGNICTKVKTVNGVPLLPVPSARMKTSYVFADGKTEGEENGGFKAGTEAKDINWIIMPKKAPIAISRQDKMKIIDPQTYQKADAWFIGYRKYHEVWVLKNQLGNIVPNIAGSKGV